MKFSKHLTGLAVVISLSGSPLYAQNPVALAKKQVLQWVDSHQESLNNAAQEIWQFAETALLEYQSADCLAEMLEEEGFKVDRGVADMPTAFVATYGSGKPVMGILAEYDAMPGLSQNVNTAVKEALKPGEPGHGCGHNLFGVASSGAAMALKAVMQEHGYPVPFF